MFNCRLSGQFTVLISLIGLTVATRVVLDPKIEPNIQECHHIYRTTFANLAYWDLASADLLNDTDIADHYREPTTGQPNDFSKTDFRFSGLKFLEWDAKLNYMISLEERLALHVYDEPSDRELAAGPQVDQEMCGLHLDYMLLMLRKYLPKLTRSSDYSMFRIMHSSDGPNFSLSNGNTIFFGNYHQCVHSKLNVIRHELAKINTSAADAFFQSRSAPGELKSSLLQKLAGSLGPFVGYLEEPKLELVHTHQDKIQLLDMRYCVASLRYPEWRNDTFARRNLNLRVAVCLPETCDSRSIDLYRDQITKLVDFNIKHYYSGYYLSELYCLPDEQSELRNPFNYVDSTLFIWFNVVWLSLVVLATGVSIYRTHYFEVDSGADKTYQADWWHYLSSWSLTKNFKKFLGSRKSLDLAKSKNSDINPNSNSGQKLGAIEEIRVDLKPMEGFKVVSALAVIASHASMILFSNSWNQTDGHDLLSRTFIGAANTVFPAVVDNFFVATGILTVMTLMRMPRQQLESKKFWPLFIVYRYLRIVPLYVLLHWFIQSYFRFLNAGPKWDYGTSRTAWISMCQNESLWTVIFPMANLVSPGKHCNHVGWYLANDIYFSLLVPILTIIYLKDQVLGLLVTVMSSILVLANHIAYYLTLEADGRSVLEPSMIMLAQVVEEFWAGYVMPQYRCLAFLIGVGAGHLLHRYELGEIRQWPRWFLVGGRIFVALNAYLLCFLPFLAHLVPLDDKRLVLVIGSVISGSMHGITSVAAACFILMLCTGHLPGLAYLFSLEFLKPLAATGLSTLLVHIPMLYYHSQSLTQLPQLTKYNFIVTIIIWCLESLALSVVVHLLYETPLQKILVKMVIGRIGYTRGNNDSKLKPNNEDKVRRSSDKPIVINERKVKQKDH